MSTDNFEDSQSYRAVEWEPNRVVFHRDEFALLESVLRCVATKLVYSHYPGSGWVDDWQRHTLAAVFEAVRRSVAKHSSGTPELLKHRSWGLGNSARNYGFLGVLSGCLVVFVHCCSTSAENNTGWKAADEVENSECSEHQKVEVLDTHIAVLEAHLKGGLSGSTVA